MRPVLGLLGEGLLAGERPRDPLGLGPQPRRLGARAVLAGRRASHEQPDEDDRHDDDGEEDEELGGGHADFLSSGHRGVGIGGQPTVGTVAGPRRVTPSSLPLRWET
ncbi:hypothetical protein G7075_14705 [Phycicoccus sp. HDW14]|uniref:hypothetical protein n=1 Tax=Phycicoccus sp. HDW14 TaxID=2714941 RepID=UPI001409278C|nr:hypothetical protein [Phycicoccus sp. HDW14]QIM22092.1 hypothetical protein G7075_14705 [Phycicoccus sp. HDW14]